MREESVDVESKVGVESVVGRQRRAVTPAS